MGKKVNKYFVSYTNGVLISRISVKTDIEGYCIGVIEPFFPTETELKEWGDKKLDEWIKANNKRMIAICKLLNEQNL